MTHTISFPGLDVAAIAVPSGQTLSTHLTAQNSPILFGCRTGICGTCLVSLGGLCPPPDAAEQELLDLLAPGNPTARLACQVQITADVALERLSP